MALTDQPYLPLYVGDWLSNNKLKLCSAKAHGIMINIMLLMHKEETYGKILLKQKFKQSDSKCFNFASMFAKLLPFDLLDLQEGLQELLDEKALVIDGDYLVCNRMVKDAELSQKRANSGKKGGESSTISRLKPFRKFAQAKIQANAENETVIEIENTSLEKSEKPFLKNVSAPWQSDNDFQELYRQWVDMRMDEHGEDWRDGQHSTLMKELKQYSKHDAMFAINRAIQGNYKVIYPNHLNGNSTEQVLKDLDKKPPPPVMQDSRWEVEKRGNEYFFVEFDGFNKKSGRERKATEHDYQRAQAVS